MAGQLAYMDHSEGGWDGPVIPSPWAQSEGMTSEGQGPTLASLPTHGGGPLGLKEPALQERQHHSGGLCGPRPLREEPAPLPCGRGSLPKTQPEESQERGGSRRE